MTVIVLLLTAWNVALKVAMKFPPEIISHYQNQQRFLMRPWVAIPLNLGIVVVTGVIYVTRTSERHYRIRVVAYGMLLAAICSQIISVLVPFRT